MIAPTNLSRPALLLLVTLLVARPSGGLASSDEEPGLVQGSAAAVDPLRATSRGHTCPFWTECYGRYGRYCNTEYNHIFHDNDVVGTQDVCIRSECERDGGTFTGDTDRCDRDGKRDDKRRPTQGLCDRWCADTADDTNNKPIHLSDWRGVCPQGFQHAKVMSSNLNGDLNQSSGGKYIYICTALHQSLVTAVKLVQTSVCGDGWVLASKESTLNGDLNQGSGGKDIFLCYSREEGLNQIEYINIVEKKPHYSNMVQLPDGLNGDLNEGSGGKFIYLKIIRYNWGGHRETDGDSLHEQSTPSDYKEQQVPMADAKGLRRVAKEKKM